jgi:hypothetical protein
MYIVADDGATRHLDFADCLFVLRAWFVPFSGVTQ